jgi:hypothetical protein
MLKLKIYILPILFLLILSCSKTPKERELTLKDVFPTQINTDSTIVLSLDSISSFSELEAIVCSEENLDKEVFIKTSEYDINIHVRTFVKSSNIIVCHSPKRNNTMYIEYKTDSFFTGGREKEKFTIKNFERKLTKQFFYRKKNYELLDEPTKLTTYIEISDTHDYTNKPLKLSDKLDTITSSYLNFIKNFNRDNKLDSLKRIYPLFLSVYIPVPPPPQIPPPPTTSIELVNE